MNTLGQRSERKKRGGIGDSSYFNPMGMGSQTKRTRSLTMSRGIDQSNKRSKSFEGYRREPENSNLRKNFLISFKLRAMQTHQEGTWMTQGRGNPRRGCNRGGGDLFPLISSS